MAGTSLGRGQGAPRVEGGTSTKVSWIRRGSHRHRASGKGQIPISRAARREGGRGLAAVRVRGVLGSTAG